MAEVRAQARTKIERVKLEEPIETKSDALGDFSISLSRGDQQNEEEYTPGELHQARFGGYIYVDVGGTPTVKQIDKIDLLVDLDDDPDWTPHLNNLIAAMEYLVGTVVDEDVLPVAAVVRA